MYGHTPLRVEDPECVYRKMRFVCQLLPADSEAVTTGPAKETRSFQIEPPKSIALLVSGWE